MIVCLVLSLLANCFLVIRNHIPEKPAMPSADSNYHQIHKNVFYNIDYPQNTDLLFLGDSITDLFDYNSAFPEYTVVNQGIDSDTTSLLLDRIEAASRTSPKYVFLEIGVNDLVFSVDKEIIASNIKKNIEYLSSALPSSEIILESIYPIGERSRFHDFQDDVICMSEEYKAIVEEYNIHYLDIYSKLSGAQNIYISDDLHLNWNGYSIVVEEIRKIISSLSS